MTEARAKQAINWINKAKVYPNLNLTWEAKEALGGEWVVAYIRGEGSAYFDITEPITRDQVIMAAKRQVDYSALGTLK